MKKKIEKKKIFFEEKEKEFIDIQEIYESWNACRGELNKIKLKEARSRRIAIIATILIPIIGYIVSIVLNKNC